MYAPPRWMALIGWIVLLISCPNGGPPGVDARDHHLLLQEHQIRRASTGSASPRILTASPTTAIPHRWIVVFDSQRVRHVPSKLRKVLTFHRYQRVVLGAGHNNQTTSGSASSSSSSRWTSIDRPTRTVVIHQVYQAALIGCVLELSSDDLIQSLFADDSDVLFVEQDQIMYGEEERLAGENMSYLATPWSTTTSSSGAAVAKNDPPISHVQNNPSNWGLDRLDDLSASQKDRQYRYLYTGRGVYLYIVDTGIRSTHQDLRGRVTCGLNTIVGESCEDTYGHGTHVAGIAAGSTYGVAKDAQIINVKVLDQTNRGTWSNYIHGVDFVTAQKKAAPSPRPSIISASIWGGPSSAVDAAIGRAVSAGIVMVVIAGNNNGDDACQYTPSSNSQAITVGATDSNDSRASYSNVGSCVNIFAPGSSIMSASYVNDTAQTIKSGTSMACPHVSGVAALLLEREPYLNPSQVWNALRNTGLSNVLTNIPATNSSKTPNVMVSTYRFATLPPSPSPWARQSTFPSPNPTTPPSALVNCLSALQPCQASNQCCSGTCRARRLWRWKSRCVA